jgi:hypothetical protein
LADTTETTEVTLKKHRKTRWFCALGHRVPKSYPEDCCPECGVPLVRLSLGPFDDEQKAIRDYISYVVKARDPNGEPMFYPETLRGLIWLVAARIPLSRIQVR